MANLKLNGKYFINVKDPIIGDIKSLSVGSIYKDSSGKAYVVTSRRTASKYRKHIKLPIMFKNKDT